MHAKRKSPFAYDHYARQPVGPLLMALKLRQLRPHEQTTLIFYRKPSQSWSNELNYGSMRYVCKVGTTLEAAMAAKQFGKDKSGKHEQQEANLGQKEAGQEKEKESELSSMGEKSRKSSEELSQKRHSD
jgi:hypothetical protein